MTTAPSHDTEIKAIDLFCGVGGLTHGLVRGGVRVVAGVDVDEACHFPYEANNPATFLANDVNMLSGRLIAKLLHGAQLTLLAGCAPCQPFSTYSRGGKKHKGSNDWSLVASFGKLVRKVGPDFVTMENVPQVEHHSVFKEFLGNLKGYHVRWDIIDCAALGVPQSRKRLVLLASKLGSEGLSLDTSDVFRSATVRETISHLPPLSAGDANAEDPLHVACRLSELNLKRIRASVPGGTWRDWKPSLRAACHRRATGDTYPSVYGRMEWDAPSPTITTQCFGYGNGRFGHPEQDRAITLREAAMLQTFPPDYAFVRKGERIRFSHLGRMIGNAVPVRLGEAIAQTLRNHARIYRG